MEETEEHAHGRSLNNWKWNYFHDNISTSNNLPSVPIATASKDTTKDVKSEHSFYTNFDEFSISLMKKENSDYTEFEIKETDLSELSDSESVCHLKETVLADIDIDVDKSDADENDVKETYLTGTDDECPDEYVFHNKAYLNLNVRNKVADVSKSKNKDRDGLENFDDVESDYLETDGDTLDSGIFPRKETEYFQDIGSDFFDDDEDENITSTPTTFSLPKVDNFDLSPSSPLSPLPPGKTATMSNSLLRSTICELERALGDSNRLLAKRDEKMQTIRSRNIELKKTLGKEVENNRKMKHLLIEKDKTILENQTKIIDLNQQVHELNNKLSKLRADRLSDIHASNTSSSEKTLSCVPDDNHSCLNSPQSHLQRSDDDSTITSPSTTPFCKSTKRLLCKQRNLHIDVNTEFKSNEVVEKAIQPHIAQTGTISDLGDEGGRKTNPYVLNEPCRGGANNGKKKTSSVKEKNTSNDKPSGGELQENLRIKFLRDAFFYYMIGFHPDEQINAILAILEYGDRRHDFVMEAHNMKKVGKKFNVSKVSSRGHSFVQEQFQ